MNKIDSIDDYINNIINVKPKPINQKLIDLINICKQNGYELIANEFSRNDLFIYCKEHGIFISTVIKMNNRKQAGGFNWRFKKLNT